MRACRARSSGVTSQSSVDVAAATTAPALLPGDAGVSVNELVDRKVAGSQSTACARQILLYAGGALKQPVVAQGPSL